MGIVLGILIFIICAVLAYGYYKREDYLMAIYHGFLSGFGFALAFVLIITYASL